jgi:hypothetical protein
MTLSNPIPAPPDRTARIHRFWTWWTQARLRAETAVQTGQWGALVDDIISHVQAIDAGLAWHFSPGQQARHALCVTPQGDPALRPVTERWLRAGPPADRTWEYHPARPATPEALIATLEIGGHRLHPGAARLHLSIDEQRQVIDVGFYHPAFRKLPEPLRWRVAFLTLDCLLGEDGVAAWVGGIDLHSKEPPGTVAETRCPRSPAASPSATPSRPGRCTRPPTTLDSPSTSRPVDPSSASTGPCSTCTASYVECSEVFVVRFW